MAFPALFNWDFWSPPKIHDGGFGRALALFHSAARRVPAYKDFLEKHSIRPHEIRTKEDFLRIPRTDKPSYVSQYSLAELSWDGTLDKARYISSSSGSTGVPFFWPRGIVQDETTGRMFERVYADIFDGMKGRTLFIDSFALGSWIAGFEFYNSTKWAADNGALPITIVTPGIDKSEALKQIKRLAPDFDRIVLGGYPPFVKDIIAEGELAGIVWPEVDIRLLVAGEAISVAWKNAMLERIGKAGKYHHLVNVYGMAESGVVAHDTPLAQLLREHAAEISGITLSDGLPVTGMYQYYPEIRYFEAEPGQALALTTDAGLPLVRYDTRDVGGIIERSTVEQLGPSFHAAARERGIDLSQWQLPFVYLNGRKDLSVSFYALMIYVENVKYVLEESPYAPLLSGLFTMGVEDTPELDQRFIVTIELTERTAPPDLAKTLAMEIAHGLSRVNSEYAKLLTSLGDRALPTVQLVPRGDIQTVPGRKHKWVKRS